MNSNKFEFKTIDHCVYRETPKSYRTNQIVGSLKGTEVYIKKSKMLVPDTRLLFKHNSFIYTLFCFEEDEEKGKTLLAVRVAEDFSTVMVGVDKLKKVFYGGVK